MALKMASPCLTSLALLASISLAFASDHVHYMFHDTDHVLFGKSEEDVKRELHYAYSWGYETPPPPELEGHVTYYPPKEEGTIKHARELHAKMHLEEQEMLLMSQRHREIEESETNRFSGRGRQLLQFVAAPPVDAAQAAAPYAAEPPVDACEVQKQRPQQDGMTFNDTIAAANARDDAWRTVWGKLQQPEYPTDSTAEIFNTSVQNMLQVFGRAPRYHKKFGIAIKTASGKWMTYVNKDVWWWGADDWSTQLWTCRFTQPGPKGFNCAEDRTCPGCDRCHGEHCFFNWNRYTYCTNKSCKNKAGITTAAFDCARRPIFCGMARSVGTAKDIGWPGLEMY